MPVEGSPTLWILDDESELRTIMAFVARKKGYDTHEFQSIAEAQEYLESIIENVYGPDLVISDLSLPDGTGEVWMKKVRARFPKAVIVCYSGSLDEALVTRLKDLNIYHLSKPAKMSEILDMLNIQASKQKS